MKLSIKRIAYLSVLVAIEIVLSRFLSISAWNIKIGFTFLPTVLAAVLFGPVDAAVVAALSDFIGAILFPTGAYFPGFTVTAFLSGLSFGLCLKNNQSISRIIIAVMLNEILSLFLNTLWISVLYGSPYIPTMITRLTQVAVTAPVQFLFTLLIVKIIPRLKKSIDIDK